MDYIKNDYQTIIARREAKEEGSYTCYLFEKGLDKEKGGCYNPIHKQTKEVMNWGNTTTHIADPSDDGGSDGFRKRENQ